MKKAREKLRLTYRDVERASQQIAGRRGNDEFAIALSQGLAPTPGVHFPAGLAGALVAMPLSRGSPVPVPCFSQTMAN